MNRLAFAAALVGTTALGAPPQLMRKPPMSQHGYGYLDFGKSIKGGTKYSDGEWRGGALSGEVTTMDLAPGVVIRIPANVPHVIRPLNAVPLVYLTLKEKVATVSHGASRAPISAVPHRPVKL